MMMYSYSVMDSSCSPSDPTPSAPVVVPGAYDPRPDISALNSKFDTLNQNFNALLQSVQEMNQRLGQLEGKAGTKK
jgi:hypothetical protein